MFLISQLDAHRLDLQPVNQDEAMYIVTCSIAKRGLYVLHYHHVSSFAMGMIDIHVKPNSSKLYQISLS
jgi:hypothetical protein